MLKLYKHLYGKIFVRQLLSAYSRKQSETAFGAEFSRNRYYHICISFIDIPNVNAVCTLTIRPLLLPLLALYHGSGNAIEKAHIFLYEMCCLENHEQYNQNMKVYGSVEINVLRVISGISLME